VVIPAGYSIPPAKYALVPSAAPAIWSFASDKLVVLHYPWQSSTEINNA